MTEGKVVEVGVAVKAAGTTEHEAAEVAENRACSYRDMQRDTHGRLAREKR